MKIIHVGQQTKRADYADTREIVQEIALALARSEGTPQVLQIYTYPEEAFLKRGTQFFSQGEVDSLCRDLQSLMRDYPQAVLCLGILRTENIAGKDFLINSALMFHKQTFAAFDKQVVYDGDTLWKHCKDNARNEPYFIGDHIAPTGEGLASGKFSHTYFVPEFSAGAPGTPASPHTFSQITIRTYDFCFPDQMLASKLMSRTTGAAPDWRWKNYMLISTPEKTVAIWIGICKEIPTRNFLQRYRHWCPQIHFDAEVAVILANNLELGHCIEALPRIPLLFNDKCKHPAYTGMVDTANYPGFRAFQNGIIQV